LASEADKLVLTVDAQWLDNNPLTAAELEIEANRQSDIGWPLTVIAN